MERECCIRGYHVYSEMWEAAIGEELDCRQQPSNTSDRYAVAVVKSGNVVGHILSKLSCIYSLFLRYNSLQCCRGRRYSYDLTNFRRLNFRLLNFRLSKK